MPESNSSNSLLNHVWVRQLAALLILATGTVAGYGWMSWHAAVPTATAVGEDRELPTVAPVAEKAVLRPPVGEASASAGEKTTQELLATGQVDASQRKWADAAKAYTRARAARPTDNGHFWFEYAALLLLCGDQEGYRKACAYMVEHCGTAAELRPYHVARACTLAPESVSDLRQPAKLAEPELKDHGEEFWSLTEQGALAFRAGQIKEAVPLFQQSRDADPMPGKEVVNWLWLALASQQLGKSDEARAWLKKATDWLDGQKQWSSDKERSDGLHLHNWLEAWVLRREAEKALGQPPVGNKP